MYLRKKGWMDQKKERMDGSKKEKKERLDGCIYEGKDWWI